MNNFEPAFELLRGFRFEDKESEANALWLNHWITMAEITPYAFRPPMVVITGPPSSGKERLIPKLCRHLGDDALVSAHRLREADLAFAARQRAVVLLAEGRLQLRSNLLAKFITAESWMFTVYEPVHRRLEMRSTRLNTVVVVTGPPPLRLSDDLKRRSVFIRLLGQTTKRKPTNKRS